MPSSSYLSAFVWLVVVVLIAFGVTMLFLSRPEPTTITIHPPRPTATIAPTAIPPPILVYVTGEVRQPEKTYILPFASRVSDAIDAAGGLTDLANKSLVNLAGRLRDGDHVHVYSTASAVDTQGLPTPSGGAKLYINSATRSELETLPNIGPALADRIMQYREEIGPFASLADLDNVSGIGEATLEKLRDLIAFD